MFIFGLWYNTSKCPRKPSENSGEPARFTILVISITLSWLYQFSFVKLWIFWHSGFWHWIIFMKVLSEGKWSNLNVKLWLNFLDFGKHLLSDFCISLETWNKQSERKLFKIKLQLLLQQIYNLLVKKNQVVNSMVE